MKFLLLVVPIVVVLSAMSASREIAPDAGSGESVLLIANKGEQTLGIVDPQVGTQVATVAEGGVTGHEVIASPDGRTAYVPIYGNSGVGKPGTDGTKIDVIDIASRKVTGTIDFGHGVRPHCPLIGPKDGMLYVTTELDKTISIIDPKTLKIVGSIPTGQPESHMLIIAPDGKRGYTANVGPGTVSVLDMESRKTIIVIPISGQTQRIAISNDGKLVFTSDQTKPQMAVIDTATNKIKTWIPLPGLGYGSAATPGMAAGWWWPYRRRRRSRSSTSVRSRLRTRSTSRPHRRTPWCAPTASSPTYLVTPAARSQSSEPPTGRSRS